MQSLQRVRHMEQKLWCEFVKVFHADAAHIAIDVGAGVATSSFSLSSALRAVPARKDLVLVVCAHGGSRYTSSVRTIVSL